MTNDLLACAGGVSAAHTRCPATKWQINPATWWQTDDFCQYVDRALAAGASEDEITDVLLAIAPLAGVGRAVSAAPEVAYGRGYDVETGLMERNDD